MNNKGTRSQLGSENPDTTARRQNSTGVLQTLAQEVATTLAAKACCIYTPNPKEQSLIPRAYWPTTHAACAAQQAILSHITDQVAQSTGQITRIDDPTGPYQGLLAAPLPAAGLLIVADKVDHPTFSPQDEQWLANFASRPDLHLAIQNLAMALEKENQAQQLALINRLNQMLAAFPPAIGPESICRALLQSSYLKDLFQFDRIDIYRWDEQNQHLLPIKQAGDDGESEQPPPHSYADWIATHHEPLLVFDVRQRTDIQPQPQHTAYQAYMGVPLKVGATFLGVLELLAHPAHFYQAEDVALLEMVANQAAIVLDHARHLSLTDQQLQKRVDELTGLQRVSHELNSTLVLNRILNLVLVEAMRATGADFGNVSLYEAQVGQLIAYKEQYGPQVQPVDTAEDRPGLRPIIQQALQSGQAILMADIQAIEEDYTDQGRDSRSIVVVPIFYEGEPAGVIYLESQKPNFFTHNQLHYLEALANQSAVAIGNAQAYQEQKTERERAGRRAEQLAGLAEVSNAFRTDRPLGHVLEDVAYAILESVGYKVVIISLAEGHPPVLSLQVGAGIPVSEFEALQTEQKKPPLANLEAIMLEEFQLGNAYFIPAERAAAWQDKLKIFYQRQPAAASYTGIAPDDENAWQVGDFLFVPLKDTYSNTIGLLTVDKPDINRRPEPSDAQILGIFANHAAAAIENARLFEQEQQRRRLANTLRGVAETLSSHLELDELLSIVLQELKKVVEYESASVQQLQQDRLVIIGGQGWEESRQEILGLTFSMEGNNPNRKVIETQEPIIVNDSLVEYPESFAEGPHARIRSWLGVPLTYGTNVLGLMAVDSSKPSSFTPEDAEVISAFANQVAVALQNAHLFEEARQQVRQLAALTEVAQSINRALNLGDVLDLVLEAVFDLVGHDQGSIWLVDTQTDTVTIANTKNLPVFLAELFNEITIPTDAEPFASVINSGQVLVVRSSDPFTTDEIAHYGLPFPDDVTYVPLKTEARVIGILAIETVIDNRTMLQLVTTLADLAAVAIANAQLVQRLNSFTEELEHRVEQRTQELARALKELTDERDRVETLYQITRQLAASLDLDRVLEEALNLLNRAIGISHGSILLLDHGTGQFIYRASLGRDTPLKRGGLLTRYKLGYGLAGRVMENRRPRIVPDLKEDPDWIPGEQEQAEERRSALVVPLTTGEGPMGTLLLFHPEPDYFTEDHLKLVSAAGTQIANAINNAELYQLITDQADRLGAMLRTQATEAAKNEAILKGIADGVLVLDEQRTIVLFNPKAAEILGVEAKAVENKNIDQILGRSQGQVELELTQLVYDNLLHSLEKVQAGQAAAEFQVEAGHKTIVVTLSPVLLGAAESLGVVAVLRDISKEAEINRLKNEFISTVSHELRTPLTSIKGYADLLSSANEKIGELNPLQQRFIKIIQSNVNRLADLVNDILEISRIETGRIKIQTEPLDVIELINEVTITFEGQLVQKTMDMICELPDTLPTIQTDRARLTQILVNLIGNAWQYTPEGGKIIIRAGLTDNNFIQIEVEDTGVGIPAEDIPHIFERFFRSESHELLVDGTGLGLSITRSFVELLGGEIWVESQPNMGTTFSFTLPVESQPVPANGQAQPVAELTIDSEYNS